MEVIRKQPQHGWIEVIAGSMFSGKSEELIRRLRRAQIARQKVQRRAQSEAHTQASNEDAGVFRCAQAMAGESRKRFFRAVHAARHESLAVGQDNVFVGATGQLQIRAVGCGGFPE